MPALIFIFLVTVPLLVSADEPKSVSIIDFVEKQCEAGDQRSCERLEELDRDLKRHKRLLEYSASFAGEFNGEDYTYDNKPDLAGAYAVALKHFFARETEAGYKNLLQENQLSQCAGHYHNHWRNRKLWWPTKEDETPDWQRIYVYIVDHYYGYCLKRIASNVTPEQ